MATKQVGDGSLSDLNEAIDFMDRLDKLFHENFPLGGHANVEKAQQITNDVRKLLRRVKEGQ